MNLKRFERHFLLPKYDEESQKLIFKSSVIVIGAGGLGSPAIIYLAANGIGKLGIVDFDTIDITNLNRQILYDINDINNDKVSVAREKIAKINPDVQIESFKLKLNNDNIRDIIKDYDFVIDAVDNIETKLLINDACVELRKPFNHAGINNYAGSTITVIPEKSACLRCIFKNFKKDSSKSAVFGPIPGILGIIQAAEALKYCGKFGNLLTNKFLFIDLYSMQFRITQIQRDENCYLCGGVR